MIAGFRRLWHQYGASSVNWIYALLAGGVVGGCRGAWCRCVVAAAAMVGLRARGRKRRPRCR